MGDQRLWGSPPRRPTQSSWQGIASRIQPTPAKPESLVAAKPESPAAAKPESPAAAAHKAADTGVEALRELSGEESERCAAALEMARAVGAEKLYVAFSERYGDGFAPLPELLDLFRAAELMVCEKEVAAAVTAICPDPSSDARVSYHLCQEVYFHVKAEHQRTQIQTQEMDHAGWMARWISGLSDADATNMLLVVVVVLCAVSSFLAAAIAIALLITDGLTSFNSNEQADLAIMQDGLEVFATQLAPNMMDSRAELFLTTLSSIAELLVYTGNVQNTARLLLKTAASVSACLSAWWNMDQEDSFVAFAILTAQLANASAFKYGLGGVAAVLNEVNTELASGYEILLGRQQANSSQAVEYLTTLRYASQCPNQVCAADGDAAAPLLAALNRTTAAEDAVDYRQTTVYVGYTGLNGVGVEVKVDAMTIVRERHLRIKSIIERWNAAATNSWEFLLGYIPASGTPTLLTSLADCNSACAQQAVAAGSPMVRALAGETGTMTFTNARGVASLAAFTPCQVGNGTLGVVIQMVMSEIVAQALANFSMVVDLLNRKYLLGSEEFELATFQEDEGNTTFTHLTAYRFASECPAGQCVLATTYLQLGAQNCSNGTVRTTDYRGQSVAAGYICIGELNAILSVKMDSDDIEADTLQTVIKSVDDTNAEDNSTSEFLVAVPKAGLTAADVKGFGDFEVKTKVKHPTQCANSNCTWNHTSALRALQDEREVIDTVDYREMAVKAAPVRSSAFSSGLGLAMQRDSGDAWDPIVNTAIKVGCFAIGMVVCSTVVLVVMTKLFLRSMITAKEEGKRAVETEKDRFSKLVSSMYPKYVVPRLLAEEKQMVCEVPGAAVFFSDIHEFTSASNTMGSKELLQLLGYVCGTMDEIASHFGVYKVKTIGDAYLAVLGLPGSDCENPSLDLLRFASFVCQVFGNRFVHPTGGQVLALMNKAMMWNGRAGGKLREPASTSGGRSAPCPSLHGDGSERAYSNASSLMTDTTVGDSRMQCIMSYGLAVGRLVAGVLAGRCPMFDIWGGTVNLASRMQSTGEPGRIQVSEQLYRKVVAVPGQPFTFEEPRSTFCKGFGNVSAYMVKSTSEGLPKDLQAQLGLEPRYGAFRFENILAPAPAPGHPSDASKAASLSPTHDTNSPHNAYFSPRPVMGQRVASPKHRLTSPKQRVASPKLRSSSPKERSSKQHADPPPYINSPKYTTSPRRVMTPKQRFAATVRGVLTPRHTIRGSTLPSDANSSETEVLVALPRR